MEFTKEQIVIVKTNNQKATVVSTDDEFILVEFEDGSLFSYSAGDLEILKN